MLTHTRNGSGIGNSKRKPKMPSISQKSKNTKKKKQSKNFERQVLVKLILQKSFKVLKRYIRKLEKLSEWFSQPKWKELHRESVWKWPRMILVSSWEFESEVHVNWQIKGISHRKEFSDSIFNVESLSLAEILQIIEGLLFVFGRGRRRDHDAVLLRRRWGSDTASTDLEAESFKLLGAAYPLRLQ